MSQKENKNQNFENQGKNPQLRKTNRKKKRDGRSTKVLPNQRSMFFERTLFQSSFPTVFHHSLFYDGIKNMWHTGSKISHLQKIFSHKKSEKSQGSVHFRIFRTPLPPPLDTFFFK